MNEESFAKLLVPTFLLGSTLRTSLSILYGAGREAKVLEALLSSSPLSLTALSRVCSASERAIRSDGRVGWIRAILARYRDAGIVKETRRGNSITYELVEASPAVVLLRELRNADRV